MLNVLRVKNFLIFILGKVLFLDFLTHTRMEDETAKRKRKKEMAQ